jgi:hypothetical protein
MDAHEVDAEIDARGDPRTGENRLVDHVERVGVDA